ncbi:hypothetical protein [Caulobacter hibisci]|uniref:Uncharacterized protein n=1 Tax=Caulobacter hibisci TaxID=2035993 RepID=A0ABS0SXV6_9CAUL|nr:hypothetical protein [Caulobacter hibisci]MBI1684453.1 hypothetical protein [Caulobacter hibisci]
MSFLRAPKAPESQTPPNPDDVANRSNDARRRRLLGGGRNATVLGQMAEGASAGGASPRTLTGLNPGG